MTRLDPWAAAALALALIAPVLVIVVALLISEWKAEKRLRDDGRNDG